MTKTVSRLVLLSTLCSIACTACIQKSKRASKADREMIAKLVTTKQPNVQHPLDIRFENKVRLIGYDVSAPQMREGQPFTVTWYWQVLTPFDEGWQLFTHLADASQTSRINLDAVRAIHNVYPADRWKAGEYIKDPQEVTLPADWDSNQASFYLGVWKGPQRVRVTTGPHDGKNRALALTVPVATGPQNPREVPRLIARRTTSPLTLDGKFDEADWGAAQPTGGFVQTMTGAPGAFAADARVLYDAEFLYIGYQVSDEHLKTQFKKADEHLWEQDTVELMVDPEGDGQNYFEIQVSPAAIVFDTRYDTRRKPPPFGHIDWTSDTRAKVALRGTLNDERADEGYSVEMAVPWRAFAAGSTPATPPAQGAEWRMNLFVMDARPSGQRAVGWSAPFIGDFHTLDRFGRVVFPAAASGSAAQPATATKQPATATKQPAAATKQPAAATKQP